MALTADVSDPEAVVEAAETVLDRFGRCDILVSNAAFMPMTTLETITSGTWRQVQAVNVEPLVHLARAFVPGMTAASWGRIVATGRR
jgi:NAD(P)-dependent dehydrogenase (short-subunit alcohol dehydrogenase family)